MDGWMEVRRKNWWIVWIEYLRMEVDMDKQNNKNFNEWCSDRQTNGVDGLMNRQKNDWMNDGREIWLTGHHVRNDKLPENVIYDKANSDKKMHSLKTEKNRAVFVLVFS